VKIFAGVTVIALLLCSCADQPSPKEEASAVGKDTEQDAVKKRQLSIEEAAEEATKLIEAEAKTEIDAVTSGNPAN
jgi:PBP1b-binding outer membrane lipoprotein LpoB